MDFSVGTALLHKEARRNNTSVGNLVSAVRKADVY